MKSAWLPLLIAAMLPCLAAAQVQDPAPLLVASGHSNVIARPGVTAAYSLDPDIVVAEAVPGGFRIAGKAPGQTTVILVTITGARAVAVTVPVPFQARRFGAGGNSGGENQTVEFGNYQVRYNNDPNEISNVEDATQIEGERRIHVEIMNTNIFPAGGQSPVGFPMLSYSIAKPGHELTLMDQMVNNTSLTVNNVFVRGVHLRDGPWDFQAGITSVTEFQDFLLPANRWELAGVSRSFRLNSYSHLEGNFYYLSTDTSVNAGATPGAIGTLYYQYARPRGIKASAEVGVGDGFALAGTFDRDTKKQQLDADFHYQSPNIAALAISELHGRTADFNWARQFSRRWQASFYASDTDVNLAIEQQQVDSANLSQTYWITHHVGATAGLVASRFRSILPAAPTVSSSGFVFGPQLQWKHLGGSFQFQQLNNSGNNPNSTSYEYNANARAGHLNASAYFDTQTQTPVLAPVQGSTVPGLGQQLNYQSATALSATQMSHFLQQTSVLSTQGYIPPITVALAALRDQYGLNLQWADKRVGQLNFNALVNTSRGGGLPNQHLSTAGILWTRKLGVANLVNAGFSLYSSTSGGQKTVQPVEQFSFQHRLNTIPRWLVPGRRGDISGHVFVDNRYQQAYQAGDKPIADVLVYLDGRRKTHTNQDGYFEFRGVPFGMHSVEADFHSSRAFYYTSSSPKSLPIGATADFGISFAKGRIFGSFRSDAGEGLQVRLTITGPGIDRNVNTDGDGKVEIDGLPSGTYTIHPLAGTLPPGYSLSALHNETTAVTARQAGHFNFRIPAQRSISGRVLLLNPRTGRSTPLGDAVVDLEPGHRSMHTDSDGRYLFRHLPPGTFHIVVRRDGRAWTQQVLLGDSPEVRSGVNITVMDMIHPAGTPISQKKGPPRADGH